MTRYYLTKINPDGTGEAVVPEMAEPNRNDFYEPDYEVEGRLYYDADSYLREVKKWNTFLSHLPLAAHVDSVLAAKNGIGWVKECEEVWQGWSGEHDLVQGQWRDITKEQYDKNRNGKHGDYFKKYNRILLIPATTVKQEPMKEDKTAEGITIRHPMYDKFKEALHIYNDMQAGANPFVVECIKIAEEYANQEVKISLEAMEIYQSSLPASQEQGQEEAFILGCKETLRQLAQTFLDPSNQAKADRTGDKDVFQAIGETIQNFPIPDYSFTLKPK